MRTIRVYVLKVVKDQNITLFCIKISNNELKHVLKEKVSHRKTSIWNFLIFQIFDKDTIIYERELSHCKSS